LKNRKAGYSLSNSGLLSGGSGGADGFRGGFKYSLIITVKKMSEGLNTQQKTVAFEIGTGIKISALEAENRRLNCELQQLKSRLDLLEQKVKRK